MKVCYYIIIISWSIFGFRPSAAQQKIQPDSILLRVLPRYGEVSTLHRKIFGENYRREYAQQTRLPIIHLSKVGTGLKAVERGGGFQTRSIRLVDSSGREWTLRGVEKYPEVLLPKGLRETFVRDVLKDNMSAQHPFAALVVPVLAEAIGAPHASPLIGWVAPDKGLGELGKDFEGTVCLLEEREPVGKTDNSQKMLRNLREDNSNVFNDKLYLKLKCLDVLIGDWDRHEDQWRWRALKSPGGISYMPVPRDRDQVFYRSDGWVQHLTQGSWFLPMMQGYEHQIRNINWFLWEGREINSKWFSAISEHEWNNTVESFCKTMTDEVFERALARLPEPGYSQRHDQLLAQLKARRAALVEMMSEYYRFFNQIVDVELSDRDEQVTIRDAQNGGLSLKVTKNDIGQQGREIYGRDFDPKITREIRVYLHQGKDQLKIESRNSRILVRVVGEQGSKSFQVTAARRKVRVYTPGDSSYYSGRTDKLHLHSSPDSSNTAYVAKDLYQRKLLFPNLGFNNDDGLALGLTLRLTKPGFRKQPYGSAQSFAVLYSAATSALKFNYKGEWVKVIGNADLLLQASAFAPSNTQNFFGLGNQTSFDRSLGISYYRARFNVYNLNPALRWRKGRSVFSAGPALQYYSYDSKENTGRFISQPANLNTADSANISRDKGFAGALISYSFDSRDNLLIPGKGVFLDISFNAYKGLNRYSNTFSQLMASLSIHQRLDHNGGVVLAERIGGGLTAGQPAFYQSQFLGGQGNLLGYRQFRFSGEQSLYNNLELRVKLGDFVNYVLPGQIGLLGLYDVGRVWKRAEHADLWHHGVGGGLYFAPASLSLIRLVAGYSREGWYPYCALSFRY
jgi:hypothetical protein